MFASNFVAGKADYILNRFVYIHALLVAAGLRRQRTNARDHIARPFSVTDNASGRFPRFVEVGRICRQPPQAGVAIYYYARKRLIDFMSNGGGQFSHRHNPRNVSKLGLRFEIGFFGLLAVLDVSPRPVPSEDASLLVPQRTVPDQEPAVLPVVPPYSRLHLEGGAF